MKLSITWCFFLPLFLGGSFSGKIRNSKAINMHRMRLHISRLCLVRVCSLPGCHCFHSFLLETQDTFFACFPKTTEKHIVYVKRDVRLKVTLFFTIMYSSREFALISTERGNEKTFISKRKLALGSKISTVDFIISHYSIISLNLLTSTICIPKKRDIRSNFMWNN